MFDSASSKQYWTCSRSPVPARQQRFGRCGCYGVRRPLDGPAKPPRSVMSVRVPIPRAPPRVARTPAPLARIPHSSSQSLFVARPCAEETCDRTRLWRRVGRPHWAGSGSAIGTEVDRRKRILPNHSVQIDRSFAVQTALKDRFQSRDSSGKVRIQLLRAGLTHRSLMEFALSFGRLLCCSDLSLKTKRFLTIPDAVSTVLASHAAPLESAPEHGRYRSCRDTYMTRCIYDQMHCASVYTPPTLLWPGHARRSQAVVV